MTTLKLQKELPENCFINKLSSFSQTNCGAAYGLRLLVNSYTGPMVQVRRSDTVTIGNYSMSNVGPGGVCRIIFNIAPSANFQIGMTLSGTNINNSPIITSIISGSGDNGSQMLLNIPQTFTGGSSNTITGAVLTDFFADVQGNMQTSSGQTYTTWLGANTGTVVTWYDQSGNGRNVTQTTVANQPILTATGNMTFNGSSSQLTLSATTNLRCPITAGNDTFTLIATWAPNQRAGRLTVCDQGNNSPNTHGAIQTSEGLYGYWGFVSDQMAIVPCSVGVTRKTVMMCNHNLTTGNIVVNDNTTIYQATTNTPGNIAVGNVAGTTVFRIGSSSENFFFNGTINEVVVFNNTLTVKESQMYYMPSVITKGRYFSTPKIQIKGVMKTNQVLPITLPIVQFDAQMFSYLGNGSQITSLSNFPFSTYTTVQEGTGVSPIYFNSSGGSTAASTSWSISGTTLTITNVICNAFCIGMVISGTGITTGTRITAITSGNGGGSTTAVLSVSHGTLSSGTLLGIVPRNAKSISWSVSGTTLTLTTVSYGLFAVGMTIYGTGITGSPTITSISSGFGGNATTATLSTAQGIITSLPTRLLVGNFGGSTENMTLPGYINFTGNATANNSGPYLTAGTSRVFNIGTNNGFTSICYVQFTSFAGFWQRIYEMDDGTNGSNRLTLVRNFNGTEFRVDISNGGTAIYTTITPSGTIVLNRWMLVTVRYTYASGNGMNEIIVNGIQVARQTNTTAVANRTCTRNFIGRSPFSDPTFQGNMAGLYMYDYALTDNQISTVSNHIMYSTNASVPMTVPDTTRIAYTGSVLSMGSRLDTAMFFNGSSLSYVDVTDMPNIPMTISLWFYSTESSSPTTFTATITTIATGVGSVVLTLTGGFSDRYFVGMPIQLSGTNSTPNIDGNYTITAISGFTITISTTVTTAGTTGTVTGIIYKPNVIYSLTDVSRTNLVGGGASVVLLDPRNIRFFCSNSGVINFQLNSSNVVPNAWNHIVVCYIHGGQWAYLNGTYVGSNGGGGNVTPKSNRLIVGADNGTYTCSFTGSITNDILTVTAISSGQLYIGMQITGGTTNTNTVITALSTGYGGIGTYLLNRISTVSTTTLTGTHIGFNGYISDVRVFDYALSDTGTWNGRQLEVQYLYIGLDKKLLRYENETDYVVAAQTIGNKTVHWWDTMSRLSTGGTTLTYAQDPNPRVIGNLLFNVPGSSYWYQQVAVQKYSTFIFTFDINISGVLTGDFITFFCGGTQFNTLAGTLGQNNAFVLLMQVTPNPSYITNANTQGIYLLDNTGTVVSSYPISNWVTAGQYIPVTITYTKGQIGTWVINYNGMDIINYSHPNNSSWVNTSGAHWGISAYSNEGTLNNAIIRKLEMVYSDKQTSLLQPETQKLPPANMRGNTTSFPGVSYYNGTYVASASTSSNVGGSAPFGAFANNSSFASSFNPFETSAPRSSSLWESTGNYGAITGLYSGAVTTTITDCAFQITNIPTGTGTINLTSNNTLTNGQTINIINSNCTPNINGIYTVSSVSLTQFSITVSVTVTVAGTIGSFIPIVTRSITSTSNNGPGDIAVTTNSAHGFVIGQRVTISGNVNLNGTYHITASSGSTFNIICENTFTGSQTGTVTANTFNALGDYLQLQVPNPVSINSFAIKGRWDGQFYAQRSPRYFILAGSNDNVSWYALHIGAGITNWTTEEKTFTSNQNNTNMYYYLRLVIQVNGNDSTNWSLCSFVNIASLSFNTQLNVFSKNSVPVLGTAFGASNTLTISGNVNPMYNGIYTSSSSTNFGNSEAFRAFQDPIRTDANAWVTLNTTYSVTYPYAHTGGINTSVSGTNVAGEWLQLQVPTAMVITSFILRAQQTGNLFNRMPSLFILVGSNDETNWAVLHRQTQRVVNWNFDFKIFTCNQNDTRSYRYFRLITQNLYANGQYCALSHFNLFTNTQRIKEMLPGLTWKYYILDHQEINRQETRTYSNIGRTNSTSGLGGNTGFIYPNDTQDGFTIEQTGYFVPRVSGFYILFGGYSDDITHIWIGNTAYTNNVNTLAILYLAYSDNTTRNISCQYLYKGVYYPIKAVFGQGVGGSLFDWAWGYCNAYGTNCTISGTVLTVSSEITPITATNWTVTNGTTITINTGGTFRAGMLLSGTGITGSPIVNTVSGSVLVVSVAQTNAIYTSTLTGTFGILANSFRVGQALAGPGIIRGTSISSFGTGTGGPGTYNINISHTLATGQVVAGLDTTGYRFDQTGFIYTSLGTNSAIPAEDAKTVKDLTGTNQDGTYYIKSIPASVGSSTSATISGTVLTAAGTSSNLAVGQLITGTSSAIEPNTYILSLGTGTGGNGTYNLSISQTVSTATQMWGAGHTTNANFSLPTLCLMNDCYDNGGWMMLMKSTNTATFQYSSTHWTTNSTLNPTDTTRNNADAKFDTFNYQNIKDVMAIWPDIPPAIDLGNVTNPYGRQGGSIYVQDGWVWLLNNWYNQTTGNPYNKTTALLGFQRPRPVLNFTASVTNPVGINNPFSYSGYGFGSTQNGAFLHYINSDTNAVQTGANQRVRWGFIYNNETEHFSGDSYTGIGMADRSAGDVASGQVLTGINRNARVEMYGRN